MSNKLPRLTGIFAVTGSDGKTTPLFSRLWDTLASAIESATGSAPLKAKSYTVADLPLTAGVPTGGAGQIAYASDGRKNGEGAGVGTGVLVFSDATAWRACDTGATVAS